MGLLVGAAMGGGSGCALPKSTWFGGAESGLNASPCSACQAKAPVSVCICVRTPLKAAPPPDRPRPLPVSGHTHLPAVSRSRTLPTQGLCACCFLRPGGTPYPAALPGQLLLHSDVEGIVTSSGKLTPTNH